MLTSEKGPEVDDDEISPSPSGELFQCNFRGIWEERANAQVSFNINWFVLIGTKTQ